MAPMGKRFGYQDHAEHEDFPDDKPTDPSEAEKAGVRDNDTVYNIKCIMINYHLNFVYFDLFNFILYAV